LSIAWPDGTARFVFRPPGGGGVAPGSLTLAAPQGKGREFSVALRVSWHHAILRVSTAGSPEQPQPCRPMNKA